MYGQCVNGTSLHHPLLRKEGMADKDSKKKIEVSGSADVSGDAEGTVEFEGSATYEGGASGPSPADDFISGMKGLLEQYEAATQGANRDTAKATVPTPPRAFSRSGGVD